MLFLVLFLVEDVDICVQWPDLMSLWTNRVSTHWKRDLLLYADLMALKRYARYFSSPDLYIDSNILSTELGSIESSF